MVKDLCKIQLCKHCFEIVYSPTEHFDANTGKWSCTQTFFLQILAQGC